MRARQTIVVIEGPGWSVETVCPGWSVNSVVDELKRQGIRGRIETDRSGSRILIPADQEEKERDHA